MSALRRHAAAGPASPQLPEPSHAERARTLVSLGSSGTLSTLSRKHPGCPFGSLMPYGLDGQGRPLLLISSMAMHTQNLLADARASLFVSQAPEDGDVLGAARLTLLGSAVHVPDPELPEVRELYLAKHPNSRYWVEFSDFRFFRLELLDVYYVGGFGVMGWVEAVAYTQAAPDPLAPSAARILAHMNADHVDSMLLLARAFAGIEAVEAAMNGVDRLGFTLRLKTGDGMKSARINFPGEITDAQGARAALIELTRLAQP